MYYGYNKFINKVIDVFVAKLEKPLSKKEKIKQRIKYYEDYRLHDIYTPSAYLHIISKSKEHSSRLATFDYLKKFSSSVGIPLIICVAVLVLVSIKVWHNHQRSLANAELWHAVQANNQPVNVVSPSSIGITMPCKPSETNDNADTAVFTGATYSCYYLSNSYSTTSDSTNVINFMAHGSTADLAAGINPEITYSFEADTFKTGVDPSQYLMNCVSSSQDSNNDSDVPGEVMNVVINETDNLSSGLGENIPFNICELVGNEGSVFLSAETLQDNNLVQVSLTTNSSYLKNLYPKFVKFLVSLT